jgi:potassium/hydrogen antiporter
MQIIMFVTLGLLVTPSNILPLMGVGFLMALVLIFIARPLSVFISLIPFRMGSRQKLFVSWVGLRGAVPIVLATYPLTAGVVDADIMFNVVFFISVTSVLLQGTTLPVIARWLKVTVPVNLKKKSVLDIEMAWKTKSIFRIVEVAKDFGCINKAIVDLKLPNSIVIALIERNNKFFVSDGSTRIHPHDKLYIMADKEQDLEQLTHCITTFE